MFKLTTDDAEGQAPEIAQTLDELAREEARRMIAAALEAEVAQYVEALCHHRDENGHALVVRSGRSHHERTVQMGAGSIKVRAPRVDDRRPEHRFTSKILPPYIRRSPRLEEAVPVLYLRGLSTGDFSEALEAILGSEAAGFSSTTVTRLLSVWQEEYQTWRKRSLAGKEYVYIWADGIYFNIRLEEHRLTCLVVVGVRPDGRKEVIALEDGYRESTESWASVLRDLKRRGMRAPVLAVGDGNLGFWWAHTSSAFPNYQIVSVPDLGSSQTEDLGESAKRSRKENCPFRPHSIRSPPQHEEKRRPRMVDSTRGHLASPSSGIGDSPAMRAALVVSEQAPEAQRLWAGSHQRPAVYDRPTARQRRHPQAVGRTLPQRQGARGRAPPHRI